MKIKNTKTAYGLITILLHWVMAILLAVLFSMGLYMTSLDYYDSLYHSLPYWHKSFGILAILLLLMRFFWRIKNIKPDDINTQKNYEVLLANFIQNVFYALILFIGITGYLISTAKGKSIEFFYFIEIPAVTQFIDDSVVDLVGEIHLTMAILLSFLVLLHASAALKHHFIDRDNTLKRMMKN